MKQFQMQVPAGSKVKQFCQHEKGIVIITTFDTTGRKIVTRYDFNQPGPITTILRRRLLTPTR